MSEICWRIGMMESLTWSIGIMEYWNNAFKKKKKNYKLFVFDTHYSNIPTFHVVFSKLRNLGLS